MNYEVQWPPGGGWPLAAALAGAIGTIWLSFSPNSAVWTWLVAVLTVLFLGWAGWRSAWKCQEEHPLWGREELYPVMTQLDRQLRLGFQLSIVLPLFAVMFWSSGEWPLPLGLLLGVGGLAYLLPWMVAACRNHIARPLPRQQDITLAEDDLNSLQSEEVVGVEVDDEGRLLIVYRTGEAYVKHVASTRAATYKLPVRGIEISRDQWQASWVEQLRQAVRRQGKDEAPPRPFPLFRQADPEQDTNPRFLVRTSYGELAIGRDRYADLGNLLVRWGYAVHTHTPTLTLHSPQADLAIPTQKALGRPQAPSNAERDTSPRTVKSAPAPARPQRQGTKPLEFFQFQLMGALLLAFLLPMLGLMLGIWLSPAPLTESQVEQLCLSAARQQIGSEKYDFQLLTSRGKGVSHTVWVTRKGSSDAAYTASCEIERWGENGAEAVLKWRY